MICDHCGRDVGDDWAWCWFDMDEFEDGMLICKDCAADEIADYRAQAEVAANTTAQEAAE